MRRFVNMFILVVFVWLVGFGWFMAKVPMKPLDIQRNIDAVVVFTGGSARFDTGVSLAEEKNAEVLFVSGVGHGVSEKDLLAKKIDIPLSLGHKAKNTIQNIQETMEWLDGKDIQHVAIVTAFYHMPRVMLEFQRVSSFDNRHILYYPAFPEQSPAEQWWLSKTSLTHLFSEYHKYTYRLFYL